MRSRVLLPDEVVAGASLRGMLVAAALGGGVALALALLPTIDAWQRGL
jgi:hypothetical protein